MCSFRYFSVFMMVIAATLTACSTASSIQRADKSKSGFDGAVYTGVETVIRDDIPDSKSFRIFHQGATGFVSLQTIRESAESRAKDYCENKGLRYELLRERVSVGAHIAGNFPRAELVFTCLPREILNSSPEIPAKSMNRYDELRELKSLLDEGIITQDEYEKEKGEILSK